MEQQNRPQPILTIRPKYVEDLVRIEILFYCFIATFGLTILGGVAIMLVSMILGLGSLLPPWLGFFALLVACLIFLPPHIQKTIKSNMAGTYCHFYRDHLSYQNFQWLIFKRKGRIKYADISDVAERSNIFQTRYNVGDIWIIAPNMPLDAGQRFPGVKIRNIALNANLTDQFETIIFQNTMDIYADTSADTPADTKEKAADENAT